VGGNRLDQFAPAGARLAERHASGHLGQLVLAGGVHDQNPGGDQRVMRAFDVPGFTTQFELQTIGEIARRVRPRTVLEIGSWAGRSAIAWAESLPDSTIYCVDPWKEIHHYLGGKPGGTPVSVYFNFLEHTAPFANIHGIRCYSKDLVYWPFATVDLVFIDGDHWPESISLDLEIAERLTEGRGVICGHDYGNPDVNTRDLAGVVDKWHAARGYSLTTYPGTYLWELSSDGSKNGQGAARYLQGVE
jgi:hypothetical protein